MGRFFKKAKHARRSAEHQKSAGEVRLIDIIDTANLLTKYDVDCDYDYEKRQYILTQEQYDALLSNMKDPRYVEKFVIDPESGKSQYTPMWGGGSFASRKEAQDLSKLPIEELRELAIRDNLKHEQEAIMLYGKYINALPQGDPIRKGLEDIRKEERKHSGELHQLLFQTSAEEVFDFEEGKGEVMREGKRKTANEIAQTMLDTPDGLISCKLVDEPNGKVSVQFSGVDAPWIAGYYSVEDFTSHVGELYTDYGAGISICGETVRDIRLWVKDEMSANSRSTMAKRKKAVAILNDLQFMQFPAGGVDEAYMAEIGPYRVEVILQGDEWCSSVIDISSDVELFAGSPVEDFDESADESLDFIIKQGSKKRTYRKKTKVAYPYIHITDKGGTLAAEYGDDGAGTYVDLPETVGEIPSGISFGESFELDEDDVEEYDLKPDNPDLGWAVLDYLKETKMASRKKADDGWDCQLSDEGPYAWKEQGGLEGYYMLEPNEDGTFDWNVCNSDGYDVIAYGTEATGEEAKKKTEEALTSYQFLANRRKKAGQQVGFDNGMMLFFGESPTDDGISIWLSCITEDGLRKDAPSGTRFANGDLDGFVGYVVNTINELGWAKDWQPSDTDLSKLIDAFEGFTMYHGASRKQARSLEWKDISDQMAGEAWVAEVDSDHEIMVDCEEDTGIPGFTVYYAERFGSIIEWMGGRDNPATFETAEEAKRAAEDWSPEAEWEKEGSVKRKQSKRDEIRCKIAAMDTDEFAADIENDMYSEGPWETEDEARDALMDMIANKMLYADDIFSLAQEYLNDQDVLAMFWEDLVEEVVDRVGDIRDFVEYDEED